MSLATRCPHCNTVFRVVEDQLKLCEGVVRCGTCHQIFNGADKLLAPEEVIHLNAPLSTPSIPESTLQSQLVEEVAPVPDAPVDDEAFVHDAEEDLSHIELSQSIRQQEEVVMAQVENILSEVAENMAHLDAMIDADDDAYSVHIQADESARAHEPLSKVTPVPSPQPAREPDLLTNEGVQPDFMRRAYREQKYGGLSRFIWLFGTFVLVIMLVAQLAGMYRSRLEASYPALNAPLASMCTLVHCESTLPHQIDNIFVEHSELLALDKAANRYTLNVLLRNQSAIKQALPIIQLTINEDDGEAIVRRNFTPEEYLKRNKSAVQQGIAANSEKLFHIVFVLDTLNAVGYRVEVFYP